MPQQKIRVLVVDDSLFFRKRIKTDLEQDGDIVVIGEADNGQTGIEMATKLEPDLITMDVAMPVMDGIEAVKGISKKTSAPIIMVSALTHEGAVLTLEALDAGAVDFMSKQLQEHARGALRDKVRALVRKRSTPQVVNLASAKASALNKVPPVTSHHDDFELLVIGASTGGPLAIQSIISTVPKKFPIPILVAVHMPGPFTGPYADRLQNLSALQVKHAEHGDALRAGQVLVAPGGMQTTVDKRGGQLMVRVTESGDELYHPSVDNTFSSVAKACGRKALAVVLTGMGEDGLIGAGKVKSAGAKIWAQDEKSSVVYGMPRAVAEAGLCDKVLPLSKIGYELSKL